MDKTGTRTEDSLNQYRANSVTTTLIYKNNLIRVYLIQIAPGLFCLVKDVKDLSNGLWATMQEKIDLSVKDIEVMTTAARKT